MSLLQRLDAGEQPSLIFSHSFLLQSLSLCLSVFVSVCLSVTLPLTLRRAVFSISLSPFFFSPGKCPTLFYIQKQHIPLRLHKVALLPPLPLCASLLRHSSPSLCSSVHPASTYSLLISPSKGFPPSTYISAAMTSVSCFSLLLSPFSFSCILLPILACHFPPFFALILSLGSSAIPAPSVFLLPFLSFVSSISPPFFQSSLSSLLLHLTSYTFLSCILDFLFSTLSVLCSPVVCCSVTQAAPPSPPGPNPQGEQI